MAISVRQLHWAAGFLEGDGWIGPNSGSTIVTASQVNIEPLLKLQEIFGGSILKALKKPGLNRQTLYRWSLSGINGVALVMTLYPLMYDKRKSQIRGALEEWKRKGIAHRFRSHCPKGHPYSVSNTRTNHGSRRCITCAKAHDRIRRPRKGAK